MPQCNLQSSDMESQDFERSGFKTPRRVRRSWVRAFKVCRPAKEFWVWVKGLLEVFSLELKALWVRAKRLTV